MRRRNRLGGDERGSRTSSGAKISVVLFYSSRPQLGATFPLRGYLEMSRGVFGGHNWWG